MVHASGCMFGSSSRSVSQFIGHWDNTRTSTFMEYCSGREPELITVLHTAQFEHAASNGITAV